MKKMQLYLIILFYYLCTNVGFGQNDTLKYNIIESNKEKILSTEENKNIYLTYSYPRFNGTDLYNITLINQDVSEFLKTNVFGELILNNCDSVWEDMIKSHTSYYKEDDYVGWTLERVVSVEYNRNNILCLKFYEMKFIGGAHPNTIVLFKNYNLKSGTLIKLSEIFIDNYEDALLKIAENQFRKMYNLNKNDSFYNKGFDFENDKFYLNENFAINDQYLLFYFNKYEIAPYAKGATKLQINYNLIKSIINKEGILSFILLE
jgi:hypothetical protein